MDAVEDLAADRASGVWNPLLVTGTDLAETRRLCDDALLGIKLALNEAEFTDARLVHTLLVHELARSVHRVFARATAPAGPTALAAGAPLGCGLPAAAALSGLLAIRHRHGCRENCCCDCGEDCCCGCGCCGCCGDACCEGCCDSCDCSC